MEPSAIFGPFLATILLTAGVWAFMFARRIPFLRASGLDSQELAVPGKLAEISPPEISNPSDNLKNLFEIPVLFYALCLYLFAVGQVDGLHVAAAWVFFVFRTLHSIVHCTFNHVMLRFNLYLVATLAAWLMLARALLGHFAA